MNRYWKRGSLLVRYAGASLGGPDDVKQKAATDVGSSSGGGDLTTLELQTSQLESHINMIKRTVVHAQQYKDKVNSDLSM